MNSLILLICCAASAGLGHLLASVRADETIRRLKDRLSNTQTALKRARDEANKAAYERMTNMDLIDWSSPSVDAGLNRLMDAIHSIESVDRVAEANRKARLAHPSFPGEEES